MKNIRLLTFCCILVLVIAVGRTSKLLLLTVNAAAVGPETLFARNHTDEVSQQANIKLFKQKILHDSWSFYKRHFMVNDERVVSNNYGGTITEGQSYAMMRAVWMNDPVVFAKTWQWTRTAMKRPNDHLLGWRWGDASQTKTGHSGLVEEANATDGDEDIAYSLLLAGEQWKNTRYIEDAKAMIADIWRLNVVRRDGVEYLLPGTWEAFSKPDIIHLDPSYFAPYVYRKFAEYDTTRAEGWNQLADDIYPVLKTCTQLSVVGLPPNWCAVKTREDGNGDRIVPSDLQGQGSRDFSYDAFRVYWRMAMDAKLSNASGRAQAQAYLASHKFLVRYWWQHGIIPEGFTENGQPRAQSQSGFGAASLLAWMHIMQPRQEMTFYNKALAPYYHQEGYWFNDYNDFLHSTIWLHLYATTL